MTDSTSTLQTTQRSSAQSTELSESKTRSASEKRLSQRDELNVQILEASASVSLKAGDQAQALIFRSAIDRINEYLAPSLGADAIQGKLSEDNSAEATARRIVSCSTAFYDSFATQHAEDDPQQVATNFIDLMRSGFEKGFNEAKDILKELQVFGADIESDIMKTFELVMKGYDDFLAGKLTPSTSTAEPSQNPDSANTALS